MFPLSLNFPKFAGAGAIIALIVSGSPARADEMAQNLGAVGPHGGWFAFSATPAQAVPDTAPEQEASLEGSNAQDASAAGQAMERKIEAELSSPAVPGLSAGVNAQPSFKGAGGGKRH